jgi:GNAT superfamily N-acetyltransferase
MTSFQLQLRRAVLSDLHLDVINSLIEDATTWLRRDKGSDQWDEPWPSQEEQDRRIREHLRQGRTWIAWDGDAAVATITADPDQDPRWKDREHLGLAVYIQRFVVARSAAGQGLGAALLNWAGGKGQRDHGAVWIRVNCWTSNTELHRYYLTQGFTARGLSDDDGSPSRVRFERPAKQANGQMSPPFVEMTDDI